MLKCFSVFLIYQIGSKKGDSPRATFSGCFHNGYGSVHSVCKDLLSNAFCLEQTAVSQETVDLHMLFIQKDIQTNAHCAQAGIQIRSHKIGKVESALRRTHEQRASLFESCHMLS